MALLPNLLIKWFSRRGGSTFPLVTHPQEKAIPVYLSCPHSQAGDGDKAVLSELPLFLQEDKAQEYGRFLGEGFDVLKLFVPDWAIVGNGEFLHLHPQYLGVS